MTCHEIASQAELDTAIQARPGDCFHVRAGRFVARGSAHVVAWGSAHVEAGGSAHVVAGEYVAVHLHGDGPAVEGGVLIRVPTPTTAEEWCRFYGIPVADGVATLYKAVRDDYRSAHNLAYPIGGILVAPDWDGSQAECGGGLYFSPHPAMALEFDAEATRFLACPVALADMRAPVRTDQYPNKIKARAICGPIVEVDRSGRPLIESPS